MMKECVFKKDGLIRSVGSDITRKEKTKTDYFIFCILLRGEVGGWVVV